MRRAGSLPVGACEPGLHSRERVSTFGHSRPSHVLAHGGRSALNSRPSVDPPVFRARCVSRRLRSRESFGVDPLWWTVLYAASRKDIMLNFSSNSIGLT
jgi:hypothetical protein